MCNMCYVCNILYKKQLICQVLYTHYLIQELCIYMCPGQRSPDEQTELRAEIQARFSLPNLGRHMDNVTQPPTPRSGAPFSNAHKGTVCARVCRISFHTQNNSIKNVLIGEHKS